MEYESDGYENNTSPGSLYDRCRSHRGKIVDLKYKISELETKILIMEKEKREDKIKIKELEDEIKTLKSDRCDNPVKRKKLN